MAGKIPASGKTKVVSSGKMAAVRGGPGHMFGQGQLKVGTQSPGTTATATRSGGGGKFAKGGSGHMAGKQTVKKAAPGNSFPNGKAGSKTGSGGGRRGTGTSMDNG